MIYEYMWPINKDKENIDKADERHRSKSLKRKILSLEAKLNKKSLSTLSSTLNKSPHVAQSNETLIIDDAVSFKSSIDASGNFGSGKPDRFWKNENRPDKNSFDL